MPNRGVKGRVVDADTGNGISGLTVKVVDFDPFFNKDDVLKTGETNPTGHFDLNYSEKDYRFWFIDDDPDLVVQVFGEGGRLLVETKEVENVKDEILDIPVIEIHKNNLTGWLVTNATLDPDKGDPVSLFHKNEIKHHVDGEEMFTAATQLARNATHSVDLMTLFFSVDKNLTTEYKDSFNPFGPPTVKCEDGIAGVLGDILKDKAKANIPVHVMVANVPMSAADHVKEINEFFKDTGAHTADFLKGLSLLHTKGLIADGQQAMLMGSPLKRGYFNGTAHPILDARHNGSLNHDVSISIKGPAVKQIHQSFKTIWKGTNTPFETVSPEPVIEDGTGNTASVQLLRTLPGGAFTESGGSGENFPAGETSILESYQRAITNAKRFIYLENQYITSEEIVDCLIHRLNDDTKSKLEIIMVVNFRPDLPGYADQQIQLFNKIKIAVESNQHKMGIYTLWSRFEKAGGGDSEFDLMRIYVHSKIAIIDDKWATIGSANLDGTSLNGHQIGLMVTSKITGLLGSNPFTDDIQKFVVKLWISFAVLFFAKELHLNLKNIVAILFVIYKFISKFSEIMEAAGEFGDIQEMLKDVFARPSQHALRNRSRQPPRNVEINIVIYNGIAGQPETQAPRDLRQQLWIEHLGVDNLPLTMQIAPDAPAALDWVDFWDERAKKNLEAIKDGKSLPEDDTPLILPWTPETNAEDYLKALKIPTGGLKDRAFQYYFEGDKDQEACKFKPPEKKFEWPI